VKGNLTEWKVTRPKIISIAVLNGIQIQGTIRSRYTLVWILNLKAEAGSSWLLGSGSAELEGTGPNLRRISFNFVVYTCHKQSLG